MKKLNSGLVDSDFTESVLPFELYGHKIFIKTVINNSKILNFVFDTGAITIINEKTASEIGIEKGITVPSMDSLNKGFLAKEKISITLGETIIRDFIPVITKLPQSSSNEPDPDGFIGSDILRFFCVTIDYSKKEIFIGRRPRSLGLPFFKVKLERHFPLGFPLISGIINEAGGIKMMIDTGSPFALVCPLSFAQNNKLIQNNELIKSDGYFVKWPSVNSEINYLSSADKLTIGEYTINNFPLLFTELPKMSSIAILGKSFLENFIFSINFPGKEVIFWKIKDSFNTQQFYSGIGVQNKDEGVVIKGIWRGSPADKMGIKPGALISSINGVESNKITIGEINGILDDDTIKILTLKIINRGKEETVSLKKAKIAEFEKSN